MIAWVGCVDAGSLGGYRELLISPLGGMLLVACQLSTGIPVHQEVGPWNAEVSLWLGSVRSALEI